MSVKLFAFEIFVLKALIILLMNTNGWKTGARALAADIQDYLNARSDVDKATQ